MSSKLDSLDKKIIKLKEQEKKLKKIAKMKEKNEALKAASKPTKNIIEKEVIKEVNVLTDDQQYKINFYDNLKNFYDDRLNLEFSEVELKCIIAFIEKEELAGSWFTKYKEKNL